MPTLEEVTQFMLTYAQQGNQRAEQPESQITLGAGALPPKETNITAPIKKWRPMDDDETQSTSTETNPQSATAQSSTHQIPAAAQVNRRFAVSCHNCGQTHPLYQCADFLRMPIQTRRNRVIELGLCFNCLSQNHRTGSTQCRYGPCTRCNSNEFHNSKLCFKPPTESASQFRVAPVKRSPSPEEW